MTTQAEQAPISAIKEIRAVEGQNIIASFAKFFDGQKRNAALANCIRLAVLLERLSGEQSQVGHSVAEYGNMP